MSVENAEEASVVRQSLQTLRIIVFALAAGVLMFQVVIVVLKGPNAMVAVGSPEFLGLIALGMTVVNIGLSFVIPTIIGVAADKADPPQNAAQAVARMQNETIIASALLEGAALFNLVVVFQHGGLFNVIAANVLLLLLFTRFPISADGYAEKIAARLRAAREHLS